MIAFVCQTTEEGRWCPARPDQECHAIQPLGYCIAPEGLHVVPTAPMHAACSGCGLPFGPAAEGQLSYHSEPEDFDPVTLAMALEWGLNLERPAPRCRPGV